MYERPEQSHEGGQESLTVDSNELKRKLDRAIQYGTRADLEALFDAGMSVDQVDWEGRTAIQMLSVRGDKSGVEMMIARGADVNHVFMYQGRLPFTALDGAREKNRKDIEEVLLACGAKTGREMRQ